MSIYQSSLWISDLDEVIGKYAFFDRVAGRSVLITGAGGLICSALTDFMIRYNENHESKIIIFAAGRSEEKMRVRFGEYFYRNYFHFVPYDATDCESLCLPRQIDYIIHGASNSSPDKYMKKPVETMSSNIFGLLSLFRQAQKKKTKRILYISSSEVYGKSNNDNSSFSEDSYGFIDCLNPRNSYPVAKRVAEAIKERAS